MTFMTRHPGPNGFTMVELAVVLTVIGLLIGGVMKGQEMVENSRMNRTMAQVQGYQQATMTFRDKYGFLPGDISNPGTRLPNCGASPCNASGNQDNYIGTPITVWSAGLGVISNTSELRTYWLHLAVTGLITGIDASGATGGWGVAFPASLYGGGFGMGACAYNEANAGVLPACHGNFMFQKEAPSNNPYNMWNGAGSATMPMRSVAAMDRKYDDGRPYTGSILCSDAGATTYPETSKILMARPSFMNLF